eukprot:11944708-Heterocapsa_arctica.AAC.1
MPIAYWHVAHEAQAPAHAARGAQRRQWRQWPLSTVAFVDSGLSGLHIDSVVEVELAPPGV